jgi:hypothetical protein
MDETIYYCFKKEDWDYLCSKINWGSSFLDAKAITIMNEPLIRKGLKEVK